MVRKIRFKKRRFSKRRISKKIKRKIKRKSYKKFSKKVNRVIQSVAEKKWFIGTIGANDVGPWLEIFNSPNVAAQTCFTADGDQQAAYRQIDKALDPSNWTIDAGVAVNQHVGNQIYIKSAKLKLVVAPYLSTANFTPHTGEYLEIYFI